MKLYELTDQYEALLELATESDTSSDFADTLEGIKGEISDKAHNIACVFRQLVTQAAVIKEEEERLEKRRKAIDNSAAALKAYLQRNLEIAHLDKVKGSLFTISIQNSPPAVVIDDESLVPRDYSRVKVELDKGKIKESLTAGNVVPGCHLESGKSLRIR